MLKINSIIDIIVTSVIILFLEFFSLILLPQSSPLKFPATFGTGILLIIISSLGISFKRGVQITTIDKYVSLFLFSMFFSSITAKIYWDQPLFSSLKAYWYFYIYFLYFVLILIEITPERIERIIVFLFFLSLVIFLVDFVSFPSPLFSWRNEERRNGLTILFYGQGFTFLGGFYYLNKFLREKKTFNLLWFVLAFICLFVLTQSRMNLFGLVGGFFLLLLTSNIKNKYLIAFLLVIGGFFVYSNSAIFSGIKEESKEQAQFYRDDVRVLSQKFFLTELQGGLGTIILGNGIPGKNSKLEIETDKGSFIGFYASDVGLTAIYNYFGLFGATSWLLFFFSVFSMKNDKNTNYLKSYFLALLTTAFAGFSIFEPGYMPATVLALYLVRCKLLDSNT